MHYTNVNAIFHEFADRANIMMKAVLLHIVRYSKLKLTVAHVNLTT